MIRRLIRLAALPGAGLLFLALGGCAQIRLSQDLVTTIYLVPVLMGDGDARMSTGGGYYDTRWFSDPDSHPAVRPKPAPRAPVPPGSPPGSAPNRGGAPEPAPANP